MKCLVQAVLIGSLFTGCGVVRSATKVGMMPILRNSVDGFVTEPDLRVAESALAANMKLIEGVAASYPEDPEPAVLASMARANYGFGFVIDELEALQLAYPDALEQAEALRGRAISNFRIGVQHALTALDDNGGWRKHIAGRALSDISEADFKAALDSLEAEEAPALFWLAFNWGGQMQVRLDPAEATQFPKIEAMIDRVIALDELVFYSAGPHLFAGTLHSFRAPALGGDPQRAIRHYDRAKSLAGGLMMADVMKAQFVFAQNEQPEAFDQTLRAVLEAAPNAKMAAFEALAQRKACRLLANSDNFFLEDPKPLPSGCEGVSHKMRLREPD